MAFPTSPTEGQVFKTFKYSNGKWNKTKICISGQIGTELISPTAPCIIGFNEFWTNNGITYDSSTRRFTVYLKGNYRITMNPFFITGVGGGRVLIGINEDTPTITSHKGHCFREATSYDTACLDSIVYLNPNDYIIFYLGAGKLYNLATDKFNQFSIEYLGDY
jgi:hypothetical protein